MIIRKEYRVESAHVVRNCTSERCSHSIHGHSAVIEVFLKNKTRELDNAQMVYDFGLMKGSIKEFVDSMDHCYLLCSKDKPEFKEFIKSSCDRWIELPFNPSAEMLSVFLYNYIMRLLQLTQTNNGEPLIDVYAVRYHETTTGYAEANLTDWCDFWKYSDDEVHFSEGVIKDWSSELLQAIFNIKAGKTGAMADKVIINPKVEKQIELKEENQIGF